MRTVKSGEQAHDDELLAKVVGVFFVKLKVECRCRQWTIIFRCPGHEARLVGTDHLNLGRKGGDRERHGRVGLNWLSFMYDQSGRETHSISISSGPRTSDTAYSRILENRNGPLSASVDRNGG